MPYVARTSVADAGRARDGLALGPFLGLIGFAIIALMKPTEVCKIAMARDALRIQALAAAPPKPRKRKSARSWMEEPEAYAPAILGDLGHGETASP
jgi:hypothetical protein